MIQCIKEKMTTYAKQTSLELFTGLKFKTKSLRTNL